MKNRRSAKRISIDQTIKVSLEGTILDTTLVDISRDGALFAITGDDCEKVGDADLGREVSFRIKPKNQPTRLYTGEILRLFYISDQLHLALRFWKKYTELK